MFVFDVFKYFIKDNEMLLFYFIIFFFYILMTSDYTKHTHIRYALYKSRSLSWWFEIIFLKIFNQVFGNFP